MSVHMALLNIFESAIANLYGGVWSVSEVGYTKVILSTFKKQFQD